MPDTDFLEHSGCKRLRISSLIDMPADEDDLIGLGVSAHKCLEEMSKRGISNTIFTKMVEKAFDKDDVAALKRVIAAMRDKLQTADACPGGQAAAVPAPLVPAPAPSASPAARPAPPLSHSLPFATNPSLKSHDKSGGSALDPPRRRRRTATAFGADARAC